MPLSYAMGRPSGVKKGSWNEEEDRLLKQYVEKYGEGNWKHIPTKSGLNRCRKSCRLRWLNYLRPNIRRGYFEYDEDDLIIRLHKLLGNRWSLIAGRIPGRTANDIKNHWNTSLSKKLASENKSSTATSDDKCMPMNWESSELGLESSPDRKLEEEEDDDEEEEKDTTSFWKSLLLEGEYMETRTKIGRKIGNEENKVESDDLFLEDDDLFQGLDDLLQDADILNVLHSDDM